MFAKKDDKEMMAKMASGMMSKMGMGKEMDAEEKPENEESPEKLLEQAKSSVAKLVEMASLSSQLPESDKKALVELKAKLDEVAASLESSEMEEVKPKKGLSMLAIEVGNAKAKPVL